MSAKENPLPDLGDFSREESSEEPAGSIFEISDSDEVSNTLEYGMSEEDIEDDVEGEGTSSDLHESLRVLQETPGSVEEDFSELFDYDGLPEPEYQTDQEDEEIQETSFALPSLDEEHEASEGFSPNGSTLVKEATPYLNEREGGTTPKEIPLPDFSKFDEPAPSEDEDSLTAGVNYAELDDDAEESHPNLKMILIIVGIVIALVVAFVAYSLISSAGANAATVTESVAHLYSTLL